MGGTELFSEFCYTGSMYDSQTGKYYLNARYYEPENRRFLSQDSYRGEVKIPSSLHLYAYCAGDPVNFADVDGHSPQYINAQRDDTIVDGKRMIDIQILKGKGGNISYNGCGAIAVYNVMISQGYQGSFHTVLRGMERAAGVFGRCILKLKNGFSFEDVRRYLSKRFEFCKSDWLGYFYNDKGRRWSLIAAKSCAVVALYGHSQGSHFIAGIPRRIRAGKYSRKFKFYNWDNEYSNKYISITKLVRIMKIKGDKRWWMVGVNNLKSGGT